VAADSITASSVAAAVVRTFEANRMEHLLWMKKRDARGVGALPGRMEGRAREAVAETA
jgi:hypothetical protein